MDVEIDNLSFRKRFYTTIMHLSSGNVQTKINRLSTRPILKSFVSAKKDQCYRCAAVSCCFSPSAKNGICSTLAVGDGMGTIHIIDEVEESASLKKEVHELTTIVALSQRCIFDVRWNTSGELLACAGSDGAIRIVNPKTERPMETLRGHRQSVKTLTWHPKHPNLLSSGSRDGFICLWDLRCTRRQRQDAFLAPELSITGAHETWINDSGCLRKPPYSWKKTVTCLFYDCDEPNNVISCGSYNGQLNCWDLRYLASFKNSSPEITALPKLTSSVDPTNGPGSRRPRGIISAAQGMYDTGGIVFVQTTDGMIRTYSTKTLVPLKTCYTHLNLRVDDFYSKLALSPDGSWLASGSSRNIHSVFLFDVCRAGRCYADTTTGTGVQINTGISDIGAVDWCNGCLASCEAHNVRFWRPDVDIYRMCKDNSKYSKEWLWYGGE